MIHAIARYAQLRRAHETTLDAEPPRQRDGELNGEIGELERPVAEKGFQHGCERGKMRGPPVRLINRCPMLRVPRRVPRDIDLADRHLVDDISPTRHGNSEPDWPVRRFNSIAVAPPVFVVLHVVVEHEDIDLLNQVKKAAPWNIGRLDDCAPHSARSPSRSPMRSAATRRPSSTNSSRSTPSIVKPTSR